MNISAQSITQKKQEYPILIVDKKGIIGKELVKQLKDEALVVYVSKDLDESFDNVIHVPFIKNVPTIPDNIYSHIIIIDENLEIRKEIFEAFIKKARNSNSMLLLCIDLKFAGSKIIDSFLSSYTHAKLAVLGDIFEKEKIYNPATVINKFIIGIKNNGEIKIPGDGTSDSNPVFLDDVIWSILGILFSSSSQKKIFYVFSKHPITLLSLSGVFQKLDPNIKVDFIKEISESQDNFIVNTNAEYVFGDNYKLEDKIKKIDFKKITILKTKKEDSFKKAKENEISFKAIFASFVFLIFLPLLTTFIFMGIGFSSLYLVEKQIENSNLFSSKIILNVSLGSFNIAQASTSILTKEAELVGLTKNTDYLSSKLEFGKNISSMGLSLELSYEKIKNIASGVSKNQKEDLSQSIIEIKNALLIYDKEKEQGLIPDKINQKLNDLVKITASTIDLWPNILGISSPKTYLVLFQNNMELRPGGGFIGSYATVSVDKGKITNFKIYDVYDADGQLKNHIEPPFAIRRYLPSIHWFLRDSNFDVDFSKGAIASAVFLNTEMHQSVDGVIGVNLSFVKSLLQATGPIYVQDYKQTVNADNLFPITQAHAEENFFPGSTQKKDFLGSLFNAIELKITENKNIAYLKILENLSDQIYEKNLLFVFNDANAESAFSLNGWSSSLVDDRNTNDSTINDFSGINEANLGANKVNYYISRNVDQAVNIRNDGTVSEKLTIKIINSAPQSQGDGGIYKNYLRFILPSNVNLTSLQIDGNDQKIIPAITDPASYEKKGFKPPQGLEVETQNEGKYTTYGFLTTINAGKQRVISINYQLAQKLNLLKSNFVYDLKVFKQPGVDYFPYTFSLDLPNDLKILSASPDLKTSLQNATISTKIQRDRELILGLSKQ
jgi:hypothetical protein